MAHPDGDEQGTPRKAGDTGEGGAEHRDGWDNPPPSRDTSGKEDDEPGKTPGSAEEGGLSDPAYPRSSPGKTPGKAEG